MNAASTAHKKSFTIACMHTKHIQMCIMCINISISIRREGIKILSSIFWDVLRMARVEKKFKNRGKKQRAGGMMCSVGNRHECTFWNITGRWLTPCTTKQKRGIKTIPYTCYVYMLHIDRDEKIRLWFFSWVMLMIGMFEAQFLLLMVI